MAAPDKVTIVDPLDNASREILHKVLEWADDTALSYDVYFGLADPPDSIGNQAEKTYNPGTLLPTTEYFWRVDPVNGDGTTQGDVWSFQTGPAVSKAIQPDPVGPGFVILKNLSWEDGEVLAGGGAATSYDVYFDTATPPALIGNQAGKAYNPGTLSPTTRYYWKVVAKNADGSIASDIWDFWTDMEVTAPATRQRMGLSLRLTSMPLI